MVLPRDDEQAFEVLRAANPVAAEQLPDQESRIIRAHIEAKMFEMAQPPHAKRPMGKAGMVLAAALPSMLIAAVFVSSAGNILPRAGEFGTSGVSVGLQAGYPVAGTKAGPAAGGLTSCVENYSVDLLVADPSTIALDGVATAVGQTWVEFRVNEWFRGSGETSLRLSAPVGFAASGESGSALPPAPEIGHRYLVSGTSGLIWGCGFSTPYSESRAEAWRDALRP